MTRSQLHLRVAQGYDSAGNRHSVNQVTAPTLAGTATSGQTLTGTNGTFKGPGTITITRQWLRNEVPVAGQTGATYVLSGADVGKRIRFQNTATNHVAAQTFQTPATAVVIA